MAAHEGAVPGRTVLLALLFALMLLIVTCAYLMGRLAGGQNRSALTAVGNLLVTVGVMSNESGAARGPAGSIAGAAEQPQQDRTHETNSAAVRAVPTENPLVEVTAQESTNLGPSEAYDGGSGDSPLAAASQAGNLAASGPPTSPASVLPRAANDAAAPGPAATATATAAAARKAAVAAAVAPGAPAAGASAAGGAAKHAAAAAPPLLSHLTVPPEGGAALPPPTVYSVELGFFLSEKAAEEFAAELRKRGLQVSLVTETDAAGRNWIYVRSGRFTDRVQALGYAIQLSLTDHLSGQVVTEKAVAAN